jgi:hypothetical protein
MRPRSSNLPEVGLVVAGQVILQVAHQVLKDVHVLGPGRFAYSPSQRGPP